jgi:hypothetical protein
MNPVPFALLTLPAASLLGVAATRGQARASATQARRDNLPPNSGTVPMTTGYRTCKLVAVGWHKP